MIQKEERDKHLRELFLPAGFIKDGFIKENGKRGSHSYEDYLRELLNCSKWFMQKTNYEQFSKPRSEANGECDAVTDEYTIDFKLILGTSMQYAKSNASEQIDVIDGFKTVYSVCAGKKDRYTAVRLHCVLRDYSLEELEELYGLEKKGDMIEEDIVNLLNSVDKNKNMILLYPILFEYEGDNVCTDEDVADALFNDYKHLIGFREKRYAGKETYLAFFYLNKLVIVQASKDSFTVVDAIEATKSKTFNWLLDKYCFDPICNKFK